MDAEHFERAWLASPATDDGTIHALVVRRGGGVHDTPERITMTLDAGVVGDRWIDSEPRDPETQLTLIERRVAALVTGGAPGALHVPGDNLVVDLDLSAAALAIGARLRVGTALVEISAKPHTGCAKVRARVGDEALRWINARERRDLRLRGVHARIVEGGTVALGERVVRVG